MSLKDYELGKKLGEGAFGSVCVVTNKIDKKVYAMKRVHLSKLDKKERENALNEIRILYSLHHKNIIGYKDGFYDDSTHTLNIIMELADDGDIAGKIKYNQKKKLQFKENTIWKILIQIIQGLKYLHDNKIIHRDLKSANIFLMKNGVIKIGDLNVSKLTNDNAKTQTGTPYYAAPEIWVDKPYNNKVDIWSVGCIIYEMCALCPPFRGTSLPNLALNIKKGVYPPIPKQYSKELSQIISQMLIVNANNRASCDQLLDNHIIKSKMINQDIFHETDEKKANLIQTIRMPKQMKDINKYLPHKKKREEEMMMNDEYETMKAAEFKKVTKDRNSVASKNNSKNNNSNSNSKNNNNNSKNNNNNNNNINNNNNNVQKLVNKDNNTKNIQEIKRPQSARKEEKKVVNNPKIRPSSARKVNDNKPTGNNNKANSAKNNSKNNKIVPKNKPATPNPSKKIGFNNNNSNKVKPNVAKPQIIKKKVVIEKYNYNKKKPVPNAPAGYKPKIMKKK